MVYVYIPVSLDGDHFYTGVPKTFAVASSVITMAKFPIHDDTVRGG